MERQFASPSQGVTLHHGDSGVARAFNLLENFGDAGLGIATARLARAEFAQVQAGTEGFTCAADDDHPYLRVGFELVKAIGQPFEYRRVHRVALFRAVHGDSGDAVFDGTENFFSHEVPPCLDYACSHKLFLGHRSRRRRLKGESRRKALPQDLSVCLEVCYISTGKGMRMDVISKLRRQRRWVFLITATSITAVIALARIFNPNTPAPLWFLVLFWFVAMV